LNRAQEHRSAQHTGSIPVRVKLWRYQKERFPVILYALLILLTLLTAGFDHLKSVSFDIIPAFLLFMLFFWRLRLFDEIKDYEQDLKWRPERIVARGEITLPEIKTWLGVTVVLEIALLIFLPVNVVIWYAATAFYSLLMFYEFFAHTWLNRHFIVYGLSHIVIMLPLAMAMRGVFIDPLYDETGLVLAGGILGMSYVLETGRKLCRDHEEQKGVETYSSRLGIIAAVLWLIAWIVITHVCFFLAIQSAQVWIAVTGVLMVLIVAIRVTLTNAPLRGFMENLIGVYMLVFYAGVIGITFFNG